MATLSTSLTFTVQKCKPAELVRPAKPTPRECKLLSDIDDQESFRFQAPLIQFYRYNPSMQGKDPARIIREALAQALVYYYPFAGRLREGPNGKLMVDCTGEGTLFVEADADVSLEDFGDPLQPPFPCFDELLYETPNSQGMLNSPLLIIQVTRLKCGGFVFAIRFNHVMSDASGMMQFMFAMAELAQDHHHVPSIFPVWERHFLNARDAPRVTFTHHEYDQVEATNIITPSANMVQRSFFFGPKEISTLRRLLPNHLRKCSRFELLAACLWRCRTIAIKPDPEEDVRMLIMYDVRSKINPPLPSGYYGNVVVCPAAITKARKLWQNPLGYAVNLVKKTKGSVTEEYVKSVADLMVIKGRPHYPLLNSCAITDLSRARFDDVDFGWGKALYGGLASATMGVGQTSFCNRVKNNKGEEIGIVMPICLPAPAMERFAKELDSMLNEHHQVDKLEHKSVFISSAL
ncbi:Transferase [Corchorus capsularis]|uniref:Transferase n=1 Tax=Corchorus capsularis TaxID=210143 RepID=A0A1R3IXF8_COCAP|nr:Transferase [Corchorus capsularis]